MAKARNTKKKVTAIVKVATREKAAAMERKRERLEELLSLIERRKARIVEDFYDIGQALREIAEQKLYAALDLPSFDALLASRDLMSPPQARKLIAVVSAVPRTHALALGQEKAYALVAYTEATPAIDTPSGLAKADAKIGRKPISKASVRDIVTATRAIHAKRRAARPKTTAERASAKTERDAIAAVRAHLQKSGIARPTIEVAAGHVVVRLTLAQAAALAERR